MTSKAYTLVLDAGTTGIKAFVFDGDQPIARAYHTLTKQFPQSGWVEQDPYEILTVSRQVMREVIAQAHCQPHDIRACGITNQRETIVLWDNRTGQPVYPAIVWEDTRTDALCKTLQPHEPSVRAKTGLTVNPYFSATKIAWILQNVPTCKELLAAGTLKCGTIDTWLLWNLTDEHRHVTDYTNASRTLLFNIQTQTWDPELLALFQIPQEILPEVLPSRGEFGTLDTAILGAPVSVAGVVGDQQASLYAAGTTPGTTKITYGTGTFVLQALGDVCAIHDGFFTTLVPGNHDAPRAAYALEAKVGTHGNLVDQHLHDSDPAQLHRVFDAVAEQTAATVRNLPASPHEIVVDGGFTQNAYFLGVQEKLLGIPLRAQVPHDGTALGVARLLEV